jgi:hypothetical protein
MWERGEPMLPFDWSYATITGTGEIIRLNGQHTSGLLSREPHLIKPGSWANITEYICDTMDDACRVYANIDSRMPVRTPNDLNSAYAQEDPILVTMSPLLLRTAMGGICYGEHGENSSYVSIPDKSKALLDNVPFIMLLNNLFAGPRYETKRFRNMPIVGAMYQTFRANANDCETFWQATIDETAASPTAPTRVLAKYIRDVVITPRPCKSNNYSLFAARPEVKIKCLYAWNAFRGKKKKFVFPKYDGVDISVF